MPLYSNAGNGGGTNILAIVLPVIIIITCVIVIGCITLWYIKRHRKHRNYPMPKQTDMKETVQQETESNLNN